MSEQRVNIPAETTQAAVINYYMAENKRLREREATLVEIIGGQGKEAPSMVEQSRMVLWGACCFLGTAGVLCEVARVADTRLPFALFTLLAVAAGVVAVLAPKWVAKRLQVTE